MPDEGTDTRCLRELQARNEEALKPLWEKYFRRVVGLARKRLRNLTQRSGDEEDIALSAFNSFWRGIREERFRELEDRNDFWELLAVITSRKAGSHRKYEHAQCRHPGRERSLDEMREGDSSWETGIPPLTDSQFDPQILVETTEQCDVLLNQLNERQREVVLLKLAGFTNEQIAQHQDRSTATVERHLRNVRRIWTESSDNSA